MSTRTNGYLSLEDTKLHEESQIWGNISGKNGTDFLETVSGLMFFLRVPGRIKVSSFQVEARLGSPSFRYRDTDIVAVMIPYTQKALRERLKAAGGRWDPDEKLWRVRYGSILSDAGLVERSLEDERT